MSGEKSQGTRRRVSVVGGGIVGLLTALRFLKDGHAVTIIDRGNARDRCSYGNAGSLSPGSVAPLGMPGVLAKVPGMLLRSDAPLRIAPSYLPKAASWLTRFVLSSRASRVEEISMALRDLLADSVELYGSLLKDLGASDLMQRLGQLQLYRDEDARSADAGVWDLRRRRGVAVETVSRDDLKQLEPSIGPRYTCGVYLPNEGLIVDPARLVDTLAEQFVRTGGTVTRAKVTAIDHDGSTATGLLSEAGAHPADLVIVAAGAWSNELSRLAGDDLPLQTQRGYHLTLPHAAVALSRPIVAADRKYFVSPMESGLRIAGTVEFDSLLAPPNMERAKALGTFVRELLPGIDISAATDWMGHRPCMPDSLPVIDRSDCFGNVFYAFGNGHLGLTGAPKMAELVFAAALGHRAGIDLRPLQRQPLSPSRLMALMGRPSLAMSTGRSHAAPRLAPFSLARRWSPDV